MSLLPCSAAPQWLFVLEGFPSVVMGVVVYFVLPDSYKTAPWLSEREKALLSADVSGLLLLLLLLSRTSVPQPLEQYKCCSSVTLENQQGAGWCCWLQI
jgi:hypothetical protein